MGGNNLIVSTMLVVVALSQSIFSVATAGEELDVKTVSVVVSDPENDKASIQIRKKIISNLSKIKDVLVVDTKPEYKIFAKPATIVDLDNNKPEHIVVYVSYSRLAYYDFPCDNDNEWCKFFSRLVGDDGITLNKGSIMVFSNDPYDYGYIGAEIVRTLNTHFLDAAREAKKNMP